MTADRAVAHVDPWQTRRVRISDVISEAEGVATYRLSYADGSADDAYRFIPGQFNMLYLPGVGESAISMSGDTEVNQGWIHTVRIAGNVTRTLAGLRIGDTLGIRGPFGTGWPVSELVGNDVIVVAGGLGMAPLRPMVYHLMNHRENYGRVWLICGARTAEGLLYRREHEIWRQRGIEILPTVDRVTEGWTGHVGVVTLLMERIELTRPQETALVACGPEVMMKYAASTASRIGIKTERIWLSLERNMQCAAGLCGHCQLGPEFLCKDGPVLPYEKIRPYLFVEQL